MFELVERNRKATGRRFSTVFLSIVVHVVIVGALIVVPLLYYADELPKPREIVNAFVAAPPAPPPPPPPPPPPAAATPTPKPVATTGQQQLTPVEAPPTIAEAPAQPPPSNGAAGAPGGIPGGIAGGVVGGTVGGIPDAPPSQAPVRVGGNIKAPAQTRSVEPVYPAAARAAHVSGVVILESTVGVDGAVQNVRVLRGSPLLNQSAIDAVKQWRYSPLMLNGQPTPFILTVTVTFALK